MHAMPEPDAPRDQGDCGAERLRKGAAGDVVSMRCSVTARRTPASAAAERSPVGLPLPSRTTVQLELRGAALKDARVPVELVSRRIVSNRPPGADPE
jgi:hypothetical protein